MCVTVFAAVSMRVAVSFARTTPCFATSVVYGVVIEAMSVKPPITRLLIGQLTKALPDSINGGAEPEACGH